MRWIFIACSSAIAFAYYIGASRIIKDTEKFNEGLLSTMYALTGKDSSGQFVETTIEEVEEETPYYFPPGQPKEAPYQERY